MRAPTINESQAQQAWSSRYETGKYSSSELSVDFIGEDETDLSDFELEDLVDELKNVQDKFGGKMSKVKGGQVDSQIIVAVHSILNRLLSVQQLSQLGFWRWFSNIAYNGYFWTFLMWRFGGSGDEHPKVINWGLTSQSLIHEVYFYRAWLRGHKMYDSELSDPYRYAVLGSADVWRSHILRKEYGRDREFVKALLDTIYDSEGRTVVGTQELRKKVIHALSAWTSSSTFAHLSYSECIELIATLRSEEV